jgi:hypothetical protein
VDLRRTLLWIFIGSLGLTGVLGAGALLLPNMPNTDELLWSSFLLTIYSLAGLICAALLAQRRYVALTWTGIATLGTSLIGWLALIWFDSSIGYDNVDQVVRPTGTATVFGALATHAVLLLLVPMRRTLGKMVRLWTIVAATIAGLWLVMMIWTDFDFGTDFVARLIGAITILGSLGTIATPILGRLENLDQQAMGDSALRGNVPVSLTCPRCAHQLSAMSNRISRCKGCGLKITVEFEEPRCACGYLLLGLTGDTCPECGKAIPHQDHWRGTQAESPSSEPTEPSEDTPIDPERE